MLLHKVALITGAASGIGASAARLFASLGAQLVLSDVDEANGIQVAGEICKSGGDAIFVHADVRDEQSIDKLVAESVARYGRIDCALNNAGVEGIRASLHATASKHWDEVISVNLSGVWRCMRYELAQMRGQKSGSIVNTASVAGLTGLAGGFSPYVAAKHGVVGLTRAAALEYGHRDIRINAICPGVVNTSMFSRIQRGRSSLEELSCQPLDRFGDPVEVARAAAWLLSDSASYVNGHALVVDGGGMAGWFGDR
ncbi:SDR family oxidoreductase [Mycobacteroides abscessus]